MTFLVLLLLIGLIVLWSNVSSLTARLVRLDEQLIAAKEEIRELAARLMRLERGHAPTQAPVHDTAPAATPAAEHVARPVAATPIAAPPTPVTMVPPARKTPSVEPPPVLVRPEAPPAPVGPPVHMPVLPAPARQDTGHAAAAARAEGAESWEMVVGTSWLNKIGVLVFIVGVALLVGYSFNHIEAAGRVAIGYLLSFGMLGGGVYLERRAAFRNYAYGLVAGGWAGVYFTTFAMHDVPGAKIMDNDLAAVTLLTIVAAGMIAHSLRYRSQVVTSLAFVVAYTTLSLSPLSGFSLAASVPLAVSLLLVSQRFGWAGVSALGVAATYGAFVVRSAVFPGGVMDPYSALPYLTLAGYWLTFEAADVIGLRLRSRSAETSNTASPVPILALNVIGFMGAMLVTVPTDNPELLSTLLFGSAAAYLASAVLRARLLPGWRARHATNEPFDSAHGATAIAAVLFAFAVGLRMSGNRATLAWLLEAQLLITAGLTLGDVWLRRIGSIGMALAAVAAWMHGVTVGTGDTVFAWAPGTTSAVIGLVAAACYGDREALHRRGARPEWLEDGFTWMGTALLATVFVIELPPAHQALAGLLLAALLLEVSVRRSVEYLFQSYVLGGAASYAMLVAFVAPAGANGVIERWGAAPTPLDVWLVLPAAALVTAAAAWRLSSRPGDARIPGRRIAAGVSATLATAFLAIFEWRQVSPQAIAAAWTLTALGLVALGVRRRQSVIRWLGYALTAIGSLRVIGSLLAQPTAGADASAWALVVIGATYATGWLARRSLTRTQDPRIVLQVLPVTATVALAVLQSRVFGDLGIGPAWAATGVALLALGVWRGAEAEDLRWHGYALLAAGAIRTAQPVFGADETSTTAMLWLGGVIGVLYASGLVVRRVVRATGADGPTEPAEDAVASGLQLGATALLAALIYREVRPSMVTLALGLQGLALMFTGLIARERVMRLSGLALLLACILKLFVYDLSELEALARIMSFVILGVFLLAISWTYTRYREQIRKFL